VNFSESLYRQIAELGTDGPAWLHTVVVRGADAALGLLAILLAVACWRNRTQLVRAVAAPVIVVLAYLISEVVKVVVHEDRPCRAVTGAVHLAQCPPVGDWSFPSNHSVIAAATAAVIALLWRAATPHVALLALLVGFARVLEGIHYPHDVLAGLVGGAAVAVLLMYAVNRLVSPTAEPAHQRSGVR
jgi:membrane-associated phospholipid phosphatase